MTALVHPGALSYCCIGRRRLEGVVVSLSMWMEFYLWEEASFVRRGT
jgi:hypothetical protein